MIRILCLALALSACSKDPGGNVIVRVEQVELALAEDKILPLPGSCASACTMQLLDPNVCVHPNAEFGFHAASDPLTGEILPGYSELVFTYYRRFPALQARLVRDHAMDKLAMTWYSGRTLISYGVPKCPFTARAKSYKGA